MEAWLTNARDAHSQNRYGQPQAASAYDWTVASRMLETNSMANCSGTSDLQLPFNRYEMVESMPVRVFQSKSGIWDEPSDEQSVFVHFFWDCLEGAVKLIATDGVNMLINKLITARSISFIQRSKNFVQFDCDTFASNTLYGFGFNCAEDILPFMLSVINVFTNPPEILSQRAWTLRMLSVIPRSANRSASICMPNMEQSSLPPMPPEDTRSTDTRSPGCSVNDLYRLAATEPHGTVTPTKPSTLPTYRGSPPIPLYGPLAGFDTPVTTSLAESPIIGDIPIETTPPWKQYFSETPSPRTPWQMSSANNSPNGHASANSGLLKKPMPIPSFPSTNPIMAQTSASTTEMVNSRRTPTFVPQNDWSCTDWPSRVPLVDGVPQNDNGSLHFAVDQPITQSANISSSSVHATLQGDIADCTKSVYHGPFSADNGLSSSGSLLDLDTPKNHHEIPTKEYADSDNFQWEMLLTFANKSISMHTAIGSTPKQSAMDSIGTPQSAYPIESTPTDVFEEAQKGSGEDLNDLMSGLEEALFRLKFVGLSSLFEGDGTSTADRNHH